MIYVFLATLANLVFQFCVGIQLPVDGEKAWHKFGNVSVSGANYSLSLNQHPPFEIELKITRANGDKVNSKIYMGGMPGIINPVKREQKGVVKDDDTFILSGISIKEKRRKYYGGATIEWYATTFEEEMAKIRPDTKIEEVYEAYEEEVVEVLRGFKLIPQADTRKEIAAGFKKQLVIAVKAVKDASEEGRETALVNALLDLDAKTEDMLKKFDLHEQGKNLPEKLHIDPWILRGADYCGKGYEKKVCHGLSIAEYALITVFLRQWLKERINFYIDQFKHGLNSSVSHVVSLLSQRQAVASIQPYAWPYGSAKKVLQFSPVHWNGSKVAIPRLIDEVKRAIGQPNVDFALSSHFKGDRQNVYATLLHKKGLDLVWPAWEMEKSSVPTRGWCNAARYKMFPELVLTLKENNSVYVHCEGGGGRTGMFVVVLLMELTRCFWLDALKIVRHVAPRTVDGAQAIVWLAWYWKKYTARRPPIEGGLDGLQDPKNWDTGRQDEMDTPVLPAAEMFLDPLHQKVETKVKLREWLNEQRLKMSSMPRTKDGRWLIPTDFIKRTKDRKAVGIVLCVLLYCVLSIIVGALAFLTYFFPLSPESIAQKAEEACIELSTRINITDKCD